jgi:hypothetical protein
VPACCFRSRIHCLSAFNTYKEKSRATFRMADSVLGKLADQKQTPEEAAANDASIRESKRSVGVRQMISDIRGAEARGLAPHEIQVELTHWETEYPRLFAMVNSPECSEAILTSMLAQLEAVEGGAKSAHDASVVVGTVLVNSYVRPALGMEPVPLPGSTQRSARRGGKRTAGSH